MPAVTSHFFFVLGHIPTSTRTLFLQSNAFLSLMSSSPSNPRFVAEYAKSNRSTCKTCSKVISAKALRLGVVSRDSRGFDMTKWHHLDCFSHTVHSLDLIAGFASLHSSDQEALKRLVGVCKTPLEKRKAEDQQEVVIGHMNSKQAKLSVANEEAEVEIGFSLSDTGNKYKDAELPPKWKSFNTVIFLEREDGLHDSNKIAAFDFDGCLAKTSVKRVGANAWSLMYPSIPDKLKSLYNEGYKLVIFTNESNIDRWKKKRQVAVDSKIGRLNNFLKLVKVPIQVFIACGYSDGKVADRYRKPEPGMWRIMEKQFNSGMSIDMDQSFYIGDAAGRPQDHSDADIKFAQAVGLKFYLPEDFFDVRET
ncbi:hypothetical protein K2173_022622 [Erythroxylum novogranatense]|uniref:PARP-type domain-containing protein n=1 Tax=Erythroxylum novogranatense TaxID=1862640 RepID=A0AAV8SUJ4_9ROSI|nr:hypothetical protein K2173_022622 [Erythroxylum novogranatense]